MSILAEELKRLRRDYSLTQQDAADLLSISVTSYQRFETAKRAPPYREMQRIRATIADIDRIGPRGIGLLRA